MAMVETSIEIEQEALTTAAEVLGVTTTKDTVNAALLEVDRQSACRVAMDKPGEIVTEFENDNDPLPQVEVDSPCAPAA